MHCKKKAYRYSTSTSKIVLKYLIHFLPLQKETDGVSVCQSAQTHPCLRGGFLCASSDKLQEHEKQRCAILSVANLFSPFNTPI